MRRKTRKNPRVVNRPDVSYEDTEDRDTPFVETHGQTYGKPTFKGSFVGHTVYSKPRRRKMVQDGKVKRGLCEVPEPGTVTFRRSGGSEACDIDIRTSEKLDQYRRPYETDKTVKRHGSSPKATHAVVRSNGKVHRVPGPTVTPKEPETRRFTVYHNEVDSMWTWNGTEWVSDYREGVG